jgi:hypothetical protein
MGAGDRIFQTSKELAMSANTQTTERDAAERTAQEQQLYERLGPIFEQERRRVAQLLSAKGPQELFGQTEYQLRDRVHELGARVLEVAADEQQKKGGIRGC